MRHPRRDVEVFGRTINDLDNRLPKGRSRCFDIGISGGCGATCAAFYDGECDEPHEIDPKDIIDTYDIDVAVEVMGRYSCFNGIKEVE